MTPVMAREKTPRRTQRSVAIRPQAGAQEAFLRSSADIVLYGGSAGGGKTWGLLLEPLRHIGNRDFGAVIFRRTYPMVTAQGGMWDESRKLYSVLGARSTEDDLTWTFPGGARVKFAHMQHEANMFDWQGAQVPLIEFDELTHFTASQFWYLLSRNRSTCGVRPYVRATTNPDADSWVADLIAWWIDQDTGLAIAERSGVVRWFVRHDETLIWADSVPELREQFPAIPPKSLTFIPAKLEDNRILTAKDPGYLANLMALPLVERERLLDGNWTVRYTAGKVFNRSWFEIVPAAPAAGEECRFWDLAATEKKAKGADPDFTAGVTIRKVAGVYYVLDCVAVQQGPTAVDTLIANTVSQDAAAAQASATRYRVRWETEGGAAGVRDTARLVKMLAPHDAAGVRPVGDKLVRARGLAAQSFAGNVKLVAGAWNEAWLTHMHGQPDLAHDDIMDASAGAFEDVSGARSMGWA